MKKDELPISQRLLVKEYEASFYHALVAPVLLAAGFRPLIDKPQDAVSRLLDELCRLRRVLVEARVLLKAYDVHFTHGAAASVWHNRDVQQSPDLFGNLLCAVDAMDEVKP